MPYAFRPERGRKTHRLYHADNICNQYYYVAAVSVRAAFRFYNCLEENRIRMQEAARPV